MNIFCVSSYSSFLEVWHENSITYILYSNTTAKAIRHFIQPYSLVSIISYKKNRNGLAEPPKTHQNTRFRRIEKWRSSCYSANLHNLHRFLEQRVSVNCAGSGWSDHSKWRGRIYLWCRVYFCSCNTVGRRFGEVERNKKFITTCIPSRLVSEFTRLRSQISRMLKKKIIIFPSFSFYLE